MATIPNLACTRCRARFTGQGVGVLECQSCGARFPVLQGIPSFVEDLSYDAPPPRDLDISVVIPALNEAANLQQLLPRVQRALTVLGATAEVIIVDGGSQDGTPAVAQAAGARVVKQRQPGYGGALRAGFEAASANYVLTLDADGSHDPDLLQTIWSARDRAEVLIASRYVAGGRAEMPVSRAVLSRILNLVFRRGLSLPVRDLSSGYRLYQRPLLQQLKLEATNFDVLEEILIRTLAAGYTIHEVPLHYRARLNGTSHVNLRRFAISYLKTLGAMWKLRNSIGSADYDARAYSSVVPLQRYWQRRRYKIITGLAAGFDQVLDAGCGSSRILGSRPMVGLDIQMHKLRYARRYGNPLLHGSIFELPFIDDTFDCVICSEVIEHVSADDRIFSELERVLKPGGRLILGTPDYDRWQWRSLEWLYGKLAPGGYADEHITHYGRANLERYLAARGLEVESVQYVGASEMIFSVRKPRTAIPVRVAPPVTTGLRSHAARSVSVSSVRGASWAISGATR